MSAVKFVTLGAFLLNLQGPAWAAILPILGAAPGARFPTPSLSAFVPRVTKAGTAPVLKRPARIVDPGSSEQTLQYDGAFNLASRTDQEGRSTAFGFDARGNLRSLTDPALGVTEMAYENIFDQPTSVKDPHANTTVQESDFENLRNSRAGPDC